MSCEKKKKKKRQTVCDTNHSKKSDEDVTKLLMDISCNNKIFKCDVCEKSYNLKTSLDKHKKKTHSLEKGLHL